ncbi:MAG TPA: phosphoribosylaminoimidazolecarboxamide formyltransferase [Actinopolymorphaceae bacterium]
MQLRYGINPHQHATVEPIETDRWPVRILNGSPSYINMLDALNGWQLVQEASRTLGRPAAASFKHVSPAGAALAGRIDEVIADLYGVDGGNVESVTSAYLRARDADPKCSYGDLAAVSTPVGVELSEILGRIVCDGIIAPGYAPGVVGALSRKQGGRFLVIEADEGFAPPAEEVRDVWGLRLTQQRDIAPISSATFNDVVSSSRSTASTVDDLLLGLVVLRYTQSNSVCYVRDGSTLGIGAGQQSRIDCTRLAGSKVDTWWLRRHDLVRNLRFRRQVRRQDRINAQISVIDGDRSATSSLRLTDLLAEPAPLFTDDERAAWLGKLGGVAFASDGLLPFRDNIDEASRHGVASIVEPGGSVRSAEVEDACREHGIALARSGLRLFHH